MADEAAIREQIKATQRDMVSTLVEAIKKPSFNITDPSVVMYGKKGTEEGFWRFLEQGAWDLENAVKLIQSAFEWHAKVGPAVKSILEEVYTKQPGYLSLRQVGFDKVGRPVLYGCFAQNAVRAADLSVDGVIAHLVHLTENAGKTNVEKDSTSETGCTNIIILDCSGFEPRFFLKPDMLLKVNQTLCLLYPNVIHSVLVVNYSQDVRNTWSTIKGTFDGGLVAKVKFVPPTAISQTLDDMFGLSLIQWLQAELRLNKETPLSPSQASFYLKNAAHDPRGCDVYVDAYLDKDGYPNGHQPHAGIMFGK